MNKESLFLALNGVTGMTPRNFWKVAERVSNPVKIFSMPEREMRVLGLSKELARRIAEFDPEAFAAQERQKIDELGGRVLVHGAPDYPPALMQIPDPPPVLYLLGRLQREDRLAFSIVGSRAASTQGRLNAERIARRLACMGLTIVSGLAMGIDTRVHKGALTAGGRTLAVLGCGIDYPYPQHNRELRKKIVERGALMSEFPIGTPPLPMNFPRRNRIISGLAMGTLVIEAAKRSGSLITARYAMEQGRDVFAIPGSIQSSLSSGVNSLIQKGAKLVQGVDDIVEEFPAEVQNYIDTHQQKSSEQPTGRNLEEMMILKLLNHEPIHIDALTRKTSMPPSAISSLLMKMELDGLVRQLPGKRFTKP